MKTNYIRIEKCRPIFLYYWPTCIDKCIEVRLFHDAIDGILVTLMHVQTFNEIFLSEINYNLSNIPVIIDRFFESHVKLIKHKND